MSVGAYRIPYSLRGKPGINQILKYYQYNRETEIEYITYLEKEASFQSKYPTEYAKFAREFRPENSTNKNYLTTKLYRSFNDRKTSSSYSEALLEFFFLFRLCEESDRLEISRQSENQKQQISATDGAKNQTAGTKTRDENLTVTVHEAGKQQSVNSVFAQNKNNVIIMEEENNRLKITVDRQGHDIFLLQKAINELRNSQQKDTDMIEDLKLNTEELEMLLKEEREINEEHRATQTQNDKDIAELRQEKARLEDKSEQLKQEVKKIKNKAKKDNSETSATKPTDSSQNRFAQCPIVEGNWSSEKDAELLSLQEQNKSHEDSMMTILKAKRIKEDENSKLKTKVQQLERDFLKKAKEVDSLKIEKQTLEERLKNQKKE